MRLLIIHANRFSFEVTGSTPGATLRALDPQEEAGSVDEVLVAFVSVEQIDEIDLDDVAGQAAEHLADTAAKVGATRVMVYPYAHLSGDLARPQNADQAISDLADLLAADSQLDVRRAPFGHYKAFEISCKGHPMSELALTLLPAIVSDGHDHEHGQGHAHDSKALAAEKTLRSEWRVYRPDGTYVSADEFDFRSDRGLRDLYNYEREGTREAEDAPPHIRLMREHELVDYEPASDTGNLRWYPKGLLIKRLLENHATDLVVNHGAMEVETPIMYDYGHPALSSYLHRFPARQYVVRSEDKELFLRFAACFGQYMIQHDMVASYRNLPVRLYELTHFSFRREQGGEVAGLRRLRTFTMPDMHSLVRDMPMAKEEFLAQVKLCLRWLDDVGVECVPAIRFVRSFLDDNPGFMEQLMAVIDRPALIEVWDVRFFYFVAKFEMNFVDSANKAACLSTVQIDVENTDRFDITYTSEDGSKQHPLLMHTSVSGSIDRNLFAILESQAIRATKGEKMSWPVWLAPIQVRLLPVSDEHLPGALALAEQIPYRVDVDDRDLKIGDKVRKAEKEWVPYTLVVGAKELNGGDLTVRYRSGEQVEMSVADLRDRLSIDTAGKPARAANTPRQLSKRPIFVG